MATGLSNHITKQIGEYLVASELGRFGLVAATFAGNVPDYDIIATDSAFRSVPVQVKATNSTTWQFSDMRRFVDVRLDGEKQVIGRPAALSDDIVCVMVALSQYGKDRFYVLSLKTLQKALIKIHRNVLKKFDGVRPKKFDSFHCAIGEHELTPFKDAWIPEFRDGRGLSMHEFSAAVPVKTAQAVKNQIKANAAANKRQGGSAAYIRSLVANGLEEARVFELAVAKFPVLRNRKTHFAPRYAAACRIAAARAGAKLISN